MQRLEVGRGVAGTSIVLAALLACKQPPDKAGAAAGATAASSAFAAIVATSAATPAVKELAVEAPAAELLSEYKNNEVRADTRFKGKIILTAGAVREVSKDVLGKPYVGVGNHKLKGIEAELETPHIQCYLAEDQLAKAATLNKGDPVGVRGRVEGLMMNVIVRDCELKTRADLAPQPSASGRR